MACVGQPAGLSVSFGVISGADKFVGETDP
jgi:hypothetical protein